MIAAVVIVAGIAALAVVLTSRPSDRPVAIGDGAVAPAAPVQATPPVQLSGVTPEQVPVQYRKQVASVIEAQRTRPHPDRLFATNASMPTNSIPTHPIPIFQGPNHVTAH